MSYSNSKLDCFDYCARKYQFKYIQYLKEPPNIWAAIGIEIHKAIDVYIKHLIENNLRQSPSFEYKFEHLENAEMFNNFKSTYVLPETVKPDKFGTEETICITKDFTLTPERKDSLFNMVIDFYWIDGEKAYILDWKSGKNKISDNQQLEIYAWGLKIKFPNIKEVEAGFYYLKDIKNPVHTCKVTNFTLPQNMILSKIAELEAVKAYPPTKDFWKCKSCCFFRSLCNGYTKTGPNAIF